MAEYVVADERFCFPSPRLPRQAGRAAAVRRADRLSRAAHVRGRRSGSASTGSAPPPTSSRRSPAAGPAGVRLHPPRGRGRPGLRAGARRRVGRGLGRASPEPLDAAIIFAPVGALVPLALRAVAPGGGVVCGGIHMSDIPSFPYSACGRSVSCARSPTSRASTPRSSLRSRRGFRSGLRSLFTRWRRPTPPWPTCGPGGSLGPGCLWSDAASPGWPRTLPGTSEGHILIFALKRLTAWWIR